MLPLAISIATCYINSLMNSLVLCTPDHDSPVTIHKHKHKMTEFQEAISILCLVNLHFNICLKVAP